MRLHLLNPNEHRMNIEADIALTNKKCIRAAWAVFTLLQIQAQTAWSAQAPSMATPEPLPAWIWGVVAGLVLLGLLAAHTARRRVWLSRLEDEKQARLRAENILTHLVDTIPNPLFIKDEQGRFLLVNAAYEFA